MKRSRVSPPFIAFVIAAIVVLTAAMGIDVPHGIFLMLAVGWATALGGMPAGMLATAFSVAAMLTVAGLHGPAFVTPAMASADIAYTLSFVVLTYIVGTLRHRYEAEREAHLASSADVARTRDKLTDVLESITDGFLTLDKDWRFTFVNRRGEQILARTREKLIGLYILDAFPESMGGAIHREMDRARRTQATVEFEAFYPPGNRWLEVRGYPVADGGVSVYFRDVTARKHAQEALRLQARMLDAVRQAVIGVDPAGVIFYWNRAAESLFSWRADQVIGKATIAVIQPDLEPADAERALQRIDEGHGSSGERLLRRRDGSTFPAAIVDEPIRNEKDEVLGMVRIVTDISDRLADQVAQQFLAGAGAELTATLNYESLVAAVALLAVPTLGDACIVDVAEQDTTTRRVESVWSDSMIQSGERRLSRRVYQPAASALALLAENDPALITRVGDSVLRQLTTDTLELGRLRKSGVRSVIVAPLRAGVRDLGTLAVVSNQRLYTSADAALVAEFARRVALAADNAILYETARLANKAKSDFLAVMSHELRTPLTTVMGYTDLLLAGVNAPLDGQSHKFVERIRTAAWHLLTLIEQILIYTRVEVGREQVHVERVPVDFMLRDAAALIEPVAGEKGLAFSLVAPDEVAYVDTDQTKLRQILLNLLSNAVKFTEQGEVVLEARLSPQDVTFVVRDTGIGIAPEHLERVFDSFWQADQTSTRLVGGTGLGLSVARRLAQLLGGEVTVASTLGAGSTFTLVLPRAKLVRPQRPELDAPAAPA